MTHPYHPASLALLAKLDSDPLTLADSVPAPKLTAYIAAICWLTDCSEEGNPSIGLNR